ncbi:MULTISPECIES: MFS transporter [Streptomyces]|uniref:MFS transporter n=1 Tax=Streptomyces TaxID=1883 RepID=UPI001F169636|nr:MFS transporter [Streptomyces sp. A1-5]UJB46172.1 MFS transporter [Streptomyces sp. A1-5]
MSGPTDTLNDPAGRRVLSAAMFASAPAEVLDFLLPLWAGSTLRAGASVVGALIAVEAVLSLLVRPLAGELSDRFDQRRVAAAGALLYAVSFAGYAMAHTLPLAFAASAVGGAGGALFWVGLRSWTGQRTENHTSAYGKLLSAEGQGAFVGYLVAFSLLERGGYPVLFWLGCAACTGAALALLTNSGTPHTTTGAGTGAGVGAPSAATSTDNHGVEGRGGGVRRPGTARMRLLPLMVVSAVTSTGEAGLWMLLLLRLQGDLGLSPSEIAMVFAPGFVVFILLPQHAHRVTDRLGRTPTMVISFAASALFALGLGLTATPVAIAALWAVAAACFAAQLPVEQATVAAVDRERIGRGMGLYESARLCGVVAGPGLMGVAYQELGWFAACSLAAGAAILGAITVPYAIRTLALPKQTRTAGAQPPSTPGILPDTSNSAHTPTDTLTIENNHKEKEEEQERKPMVDLGKQEPETASQKPTLTPQEHARKERRDWLIHTAAFLVANVVLWALKANWLVWKITNGAVPDEHRGPMLWIGRVWLTIWIIDTLWSWSYTIWPRQKKS